MIVIERVYLLDIFKIATIFLICLLSFSCNYSKNSNSRIETLKDKEESEIFKKLGKPNQLDTIVFFEEINLLEYQSSLYDIVKLDFNEKISIKEYMWSKENRTIVFWFKEENKKWIAIDCLEWNPKEVSY